MGRRLARALDEFHEPLSGSVFVSIEGIGSKGDWASEKRRWMIQAGMGLLLKPSISYFLLVRKTKKRMSVSHVCIRMKPIIGRLSRARTGLAGWLAGWLVDRFIRLVAAAGGSWA